MTRPTFEEQPNRGSARPADQALAVPVEPASGLAPSGFDPSRKCECDHEGILDPAYADWYDAALELPYVDHAPGECQCTNDLAQYRSNDGAARWLCSCCHTFGDERLAIAIEAQRAETLGSVHEGAGPQDIAQ